jgi:hypothetical protein
VGAAVPGRSRPWRSRRAGFDGTADAQPPGVQGSITTRDVFRHSLTILRLWGPGVYLRCIRAIASRRSCTFLEMLAGDR